MSRYQDQVLDEHLHPVPGADVYVFTPAGALVELIDDAALPLANPVETDEFGIFYFIAADAALELEVHYGGELRYRQHILLGAAGAGPPGPPGEIASAADRTELAAFTGVAGTVVYLAEPGREGMFVFDASNLTARVAADPGQGLYVAPASDPSGISGAWRRKAEGPMNVKWFGALGNGVADDTLAIQRAINVAGLVGWPKSILVPTPAAAGFYKCNGQLNCTAAHGVTLGGEGGRIEPTQDIAPTALVYTGTAVAFILAGASHGLTIEGLAIQTNNAAFTGDLITCDVFDGTGNVTYSTAVINCMVGGRSSDARHARACINAEGAVELFIDLCTFGFADQHIISKSATGVRPWSNAVTITRNRFVDQNNYAINIYNALQWAILNNTFEYSYGTMHTGGHAAGISDLWLGTSGGNERHSEAVEIKDNGFWDVDEGIWIDIYGLGQSIEGNFATVGTGATFLKVNGGAGGVKSPATGSWAPLAESSSPMHSAPFCALMMMAPIWLTAGLPTTPTPKASFRLAASFRMSPFARWMCLPSAMLGAWSMFASRLLPTRSAGR